MKTNGKSLRFSNWIIIGTIIFLSALTIIITALAWNYFKTKTFIELQNLSRNKITFLRQKIAADVHQLESLRRYISSNPDITLSQISDFTAGWVQKERLYELCWAPKVLTNARTNWENQNLKQAPHPKIWEKGVQNQLIEATDKQFYFPLVPIFDLKAQHRYTGFNLYSEQTKKQIIEKAAETGDITSSSLFTIPGNAESPVYIIGVPVFNRGTEDGIRNLRGLVTSFISPKEILRMIHVVKDAKLYFTFSTPGNGNAVIYSAQNGADGRTVILRESASAPNMLFQTDIQLVNRFMRVAISTTDSQIDAITGSWPFLIPPVGILLTILCAAYLRTIQTNQIKIERGLEMRSKELIENERRFRYLAENAKDIVFLYRVLPAAGFEYISPSAQQITGYSQNEYYDNPFIFNTIIHPDDLERVNRESSRDSDGEPIVYRILHKQGRIVWIEMRVSISFDENGTLAHFTGISRDITEQKLQEISAREASNVMLSAQGLGPSGTWHQDFKTGMLTVSDSLRNILGLRNNSELPANVFMSMVHPDDRELVRSRSIFDSEGQNKNDIQYRIINSAGNQRVLHEISKIETDEQAQPVQAVGMVIDITEKHKIDVELTNALREAETANKVKSEFLAVMSHEIRTPLTGVLGYIHLMKDTQLSVDQKMYLTAIEKSGDTLLAVVNDILDFSKMEAGKMELDNQSSHLPTFLLETFNIIQPAAKSKSIALAIQMDADLPEYISTDFFRLRQMLLNLLSNAVKFTQQGHIELKCKILQKQQNQVKLAFSVKDTGIGMNQSEIDKLFIPFQQADTSMSRKYGGSGLGLSIVDRIAKVLGLKITVESSEGKGSSFTFTGNFDLAEKYVQTTINTLETNPIEPGTLNLILAEDDEVNATLTTKLLEKLGHRATVAQDGFQVLKILESGKYDGILMDLHMPGKNGIETTREIRDSEMLNLTKPIKIVALTADALPGDREKCLAAGMNDYLTKPIDIEKLKLVLASLQA
ncbi:MAG: PAS domain-containing protein [Leptospiraceae bacterium]|nr:PAS domain-containing protein [Leptospiraceae bacterium]